MSKEADTRGFCRLQCLKCMLMISAGNPGKASTHVCKPHNLERVHKARAQLIAEDEASLSPNKCMDKFAVSAAQQQQFHRMFLTHLII